VSIEFFKAHIDSRYAKQAHIECYKQAGKAGWKTMVMNNFWRDARCTYCSQKLQCKCGVYRVTEPATGECKHGSRDFD
jgi:hypothetical protein